MHLKFVNGYERKYNIGATQMGNIMKEIQEINEHVEFERALQGQDDELEDEIWAPLRHLEAKSVIIYTRDLICKFWLRPFADEIYSRFFKKPLRLFKYCMWTGGQSLLIMRIARCNLVKRSFAEFSFVLLSSTEKAS